MQNISKTNCYKFIHITYSSQRCHNASLVNRTFFIQTNASVFRLNISGLDQNKISNIPHMVELCATMLSYSRTLCVCVFANKVFHCFSLVFYHCTLLSAYVLHSAKPWCNISWRWFACKWMENKSINVSVELTLTNRVVCWLI